MRVTVLYPFFDHPAIEERYASWQAQMLFRQASSDVDLFTYDPRQSVAKLAKDVVDDYVVVVTDPLLVPPPGVADRLLTAIEQTGAIAAVPVTNEAGNAAQRTAPPAPYLTMRELESVAAAMPGATATMAVWDESDPGLFFCRRGWLQTVKGSARHAIDRQNVAVAHSAYVHRWPNMRAVSREDLLPLIDPAARSVLEIGCGQGTLGELVKKRQKCRYVGIEIDRDASNLARKRLDDVYCGDVIEIVEILSEQFESIVCSEIVEHVVDPWSLLINLREACKPGGQIVISIPNIANAAVINDLLHGRFDYTYIGLACAGHLRFFTRRSIEEMMFISGWEVASIVPQQVASVGAEDLLRRLDGSGVEFSREDLLPTGFYVIGRNPRA